jgi:dTDP-glucose 4,6-dehydratase
MYDFFVLGSNSFSGAAFIEHALRNNFKVIGISRKDEINPVFLPYKQLGKNLAENFQFYRCDLNHDLPVIINLLNQHTPKYVVNFAAQSMVAESWLHPEDWMNTNIVATVKFHDQLRKCDFIKKYIHISTPEVYGSCSGLIQEHTQYNPSTPYAISRAACDMWLMALHKNYQFPVVFTRAANVYGAGQQLYRIIPKTILTIKLGKKLPLHGGGHSMRSFIHIKDVAEGTLQVALQAKAPEIYHFSTTRNIAIRDVVELICQKLKVNFAEYVDIASDRPGKDAAYLLDANQARKKLGWNDTILLEEGIEDTIRWVDKHLGILKTMSMDYIHQS